jgi:heterodisulfide reductase subunit C
LDRCPQGGDVGEVMFAIRNLAVKRGNVPYGVIAQARSLYETGRVINPVRSILIQREKFGLSKMPSTNIEDVQKILKKTALGKIIKSEQR